MGDDIVKGKTNEISVLIVDDREENRILESDILKNMGYQSYLAESAKEALQILESVTPQLILTDISMPKINGYEFIKILNNNPITRQIPVIIVSELDATADRIKGYELGIVDFISKPFEVEEFTVRITNHIKMSKMQLEVEEFNKKLNIVVSQQISKIEEEQKNILFALAKLTETSKNNGDYSHIENVSHNSQVVAQCLSFCSSFEDEITNDFIETIKIAALLHDIGKFCIPNSILFKTSNLTEKESDQATAETRQLHKYHK